MWSVKSESIQKGTFKYKVYANGTLLSLKEWLILIQESELFLDFFLLILTSNENEGYYFEVKPYNTDKINEPFEFVLIHSSILSATKANKLPFKKFLNTDNTVVKFNNLRKDALLIVPNEVDDPSIYAHLAIFCRKASKAQVFALWKLVAKTFYEELDEKNKWLSTAGLGVNWLHIRIDNKPKYYKHIEYKL